MQSIITGKAFVLGDDIDTDQIIPAEYLAYDPTDPDERKYFGRYAMSGVPPQQSGLPSGDVRFVPEGRYRGDFALVVAGRNFGCGSSREHAPLALAEAGVKLVIAQFYARIFFRNSVNGGYLIPCESVERLVDRVATGDQCQVDVEAGAFTDTTTGYTCPLKPLGDIKPIIAAGGVFDYARQRGMA